MITVHNIYTEQVIFLGDLHGNFDTLLCWLKNNDIKDTALIVCGDVGLGFYKPQYYRLKFEAINKFCKECNCNVYFFRGNHDDPEYFSGSNWDKIASVGGFEKVYAIGDYSVIQTIDNDKITHNILCVGGGVSIDRTWRIKNDILNASKYARYTGMSLAEAEKKLEPTYWKDELPTYDDKVLTLLAGSGINIDIVCTHTCPSFVGFKDKEGVKGWLENDPDLEADMNREREVMDELWKRLKADGHNITKWIYGHFHKHMSEEYEGVKFVMLDMCYPEKTKFDTFELKNDENILTQNIN